MYQLFDFEKRDKSVQGYHFASAGSTELYDGQTVGILSRDP